MLPDPKFLMEKAGVNIPLIGFYDAPDPSAFEPLVRSVEGHRTNTFFDDEVQIVRMVLQILERLGYHVTARTSSVETLEAFQAAPDKFYLVITDMTMPNMTGIQLVKKLLEIRSDILIIICTCFSDKISEDKAKAMGILGYVMKPVVKSELAKKSERCWMKNDAMVTIYCIVLNHL